MTKVVPELRLKVKPGQISRFLSLFQQGFFISIPHRSTLRELLDTVGFTRQYLDERVQTIFMNGSAIDTLDSESVKEGSVIALSAAMPGLVGAIFRKGSPISMLRSRVPALQDGHIIRDGAGLARLKLFNSVAEEMGPVLLETGVLLGSSDLDHLFKSRRELLENSILEAELGGEPLDLPQLFGGNLFQTEYVLLTVL